MKFIESPDKAEKRAENVEKSSGEKSRNPKSCLTATAGRSGAENKERARGTALRPNRLAVEKNFTAPGKCINRVRGEQRGNRAVFRRGTSCGFQPLGENKEFSTIEARDGYVPASRRRLLPFPLSFFFFFSIRYRYARVIRFYLCMYVCNVPAHGHPYSRRES